jgi:hypothetical protein
MAEFKIGDRVLHLEGKKRYKGTGIGTVVEVLSDKVRIRWACKKRFGSPCTDSKGETMLLDPDHVLNINGVEFYVKDPTNRDKIMDAYVEMLLELDMY